MVCYQEVLMAADLSHISLPAAVQCSPGKVNHLGTSERGARYFEFKTIFISSLPHLFNQETHSAKYQYAKSPSSNSLLHIPFILKRGGCCVLQFHTWSDIIRYVSG